MIYVMFYYILLCYVIYNSSVCYQVLLIQLSETFMKTAIFEKLHNSLCKYFDYCQTCFCFHNVETSMLILGLFDRKKINNVDYTMAM